MSGRSLLWLPKLINTDSVLYSSISSYRSGTVSLCRNPTQHSRTVTSGAGTLVVGAGGAAAPWTIGQAP